MKRREFLSLGIASAASLALNNLLNPGFSFAQGAAQQNAPIKFLFVVYLGGGIDPFYAYPILDSTVRSKLATVRGDILVPNNDVLRLDPNLPFGLHPHYQTLIDALGTDFRKQLKVFAGVGSPSGDRSHFNAARELSKGCYSVADNQNIESGWLSRLIQYYNFQKGQAFSVGAINNANFYLNINDLVYTTPSSMQGLELSHDYYSKFSYTFFKDRAQNADTPIGGGIKADLVDGYKSMDNFIDEFKGIRTPAFTPVGGDANNNNFISKALSAGEIANWHVASGNYPKTLLVGLDIGGFDTHEKIIQTLNGEGGATGRIFALSTGLAKLVEKLKTISLGSGETAWDRSGILVCSEFGRQIEVRNNSVNNLGSDHGFATNYMMLSGAFKNNTPISYGQSLKVADIDNRAVNSNAWTPNLNFLAPIAALIRGAGYDPEQILPLTTPAGRFPLPRWQTQEPLNLFA
ncbi:MAG: DUF1501 domain-containing protein [Proteobacteria bacterium]|nr:DUF1501 domain-containing protein [Pseudomonadota bacterium]